jgi:hypothetical protein
VPSAREKVLDKEAFADVLFAEPSLPSVFQAFAECFRHSAKRPIPVVSEVATLPIEGSLAHAMWQSGGAWRSRLPETAKAGVTEVRRP